MADDEETKSVQPILPPAVKRRVNALKKIQLESLNVEAEFFNEVYQLECKYHNRFKAFYDKREKIVSGAVEPTDEEANFKVPGENSDVDEVEKELQKKLVLSNPTPEDIKGIPDFWLTIFTNVDILSEMIQPHDEPILRHLYDVQVTLTEGKMGFLLKFLFHPNPYFTNPYLTKEYEIKCQPETTDPWSFEGPEIYKCTGCKIDWNKNMNVTVKTIKKRQKHKSKGAVRTVVKSVENDSFFNFFNPPPVPDNGELDDEVQALLTCDFEIGHYIREKIIPRAVLYFTGEALEDPDYEDDEEEESSADSDRNSSDDDDDMEAIEPDSDGSDDHKKRPAKDGSNKNKGKSRKDGGKQQPAQPQECAQQ